MKGISPLIAVVLLIALTVLLSTVMASWLTSFQKDQQDTISVKSGEIIDCTSADITIDDVYIDVSNSNIHSNVSRVIVRNSGQVSNLSIESAALLDISGNSAPISRLNSTHNKTEFPVSNFGIGNIISIEFNVTPFNLTSTCGNFSKVIVSTNCASTVAEFSGTPKCIS